MPTPQELAAGYRNARARIREVCEGVSDEDAGRVVPACPDWTVRELLAHLTSNACEPVAGNVPGGTIGSGDEFQAWVDAGVEKRRGLPVKEMLDEWDEAGPAFEGIIESFGEALTNVVFDVVTHEHDLRHVLGAAGARDSEGVEIGLGAALNRLADRVAEHSLPAVRVTASDTGHEQVCGEGDAALSISIPRFEIFRMLGNRRSRAQVLAAPWEGDPVPHLPAIEAFPFPADDIVEDA